MFLKNRKNRGDAVIVPIIFGLTAVTLFLVAPVVIITGEIALGSTLGWYVGKSLGKTAAKNSTTNNPTEKEIEQS